MSFAVVPMKPLVHAKTRLSPVLAPQERGGLALAMLLDVLNAVRESGVLEVEDCLVVSADPKVLQTAKVGGFSCLKEGRPEGLNAALAQATDWCVGRGAKLLLVLPADLPLLTGDDLRRFLSHQRGKKDIVISPCRRLEGTNALLRLPPDVTPTLFGPGSYKAHLERAEALGIPVSVHQSENLSLDVDTVEDLQELLKSAGCQPNTRSFLDRVSRLPKMRPFSLTK